MKEIERKFLVNSTAYRDLAFLRSHMVQGFLNTDPERTVRVRRIDGRGFLTVKGISDDKGMSRFEWEIAISEEDAFSLLELSETELIEKTRYSVRTASHIFEVDEFHGNNEGLVLAEVELADEDEKVTIPSWIGEEVTGDIRYYNAQLSLKPYSKWPENKR